LIINWISNKTKKEGSKIIGRVTILIVLLQLLAGLINVVLLAPVWLQLVHLLLADLIWIGLVLFSANTLSSESDDVFVEDHSGVEAAMSTPS
jgi:heme A synthase